MHKYFQHKHVKFTVRFFFGACAFNIYNEKCIFTRKQHIAENSIRYIVESMLQMLRSENNSTENRAAFTLFV